MPSICTKCCLVVASFVKSCAGRTVCRAALRRFVRKERLQKVRTPLQLLGHLPCCLYYNCSAFRSCRIWDIQTDTNKEMTREMNSSSTKLYSTTYRAVELLQQHKCQCTTPPPLPPNLNCFNFQKKCSVYSFRHVQASTVLSPLTCTFKCTGNSVTLSPSRLLLLPHLCLIKFIAMCCF